MASAAVTAPVRLVACCGRLRSVLELQPHARSAPRQPWWGRYPDTTTTAWKVARLRSGEVDPNAPLHMYSYADAPRETLLHVAVAKGDAPLAKALIEAGAAVNALNATRRFPCMTRPAS